MYNNENCINQLDLSKFNIGDEISKSSFTGEKGRCIESPSGKISIELHTF
jgi:hypothetical protein